MGKDIRHKIAVPPKTVQRLAPKVVVAIEFGRLTPRFHHPPPRFASLYFIRMAYRLSRSFAVFLRFLLHFFILINIEPQHFNVALDVVFVLIRFVVEHILILCRRCNWGCHQQ